jgi:DNA excision repair protein ERCC-5
MGVKGLWRLLLPIGRRISIETLEGKILAIDASIWLTQFVKAMRDPESGSVRPAAHLLGFFRRLCKLLFHGIRPVLVFDGATPEIKLRELALRRKRREQFAASQNSTAVELLAKRILQKQLQQKKKEEQEKNIITTKATNTAAASSAFVDNFQPEEEEDGEDAEKDMGDGKAGNDDSGETAKKPAAEQAVDYAVTDIDLIQLQEEEWLQNDQQPEDHNFKADENNVWDDEHADNAADESDDDEGDDYDDDDKTNTDAYNNKSKKQKRKHHGYGDYQGGLMDLNHIWSLPPNERKDAIEQAERQQRLQSRREFMPVAGDMVQYSQVQVTNFLRSAKLKQNIVKLAKQSAINHTTEATIQFDVDEPEDNDVDDNNNNSKAKSNHRRTYEYTNKRQKIITRPNETEPRQVDIIDEDDEEEEEWEDHGLITGSSKRSFDAISTSSSPVTAKPKTSSAASSSSDIVLEGTIDNDTRTATRKMKATVSVANNTSDIVTIDDDINDTDDVKNDAWHSTPSEPTDIQAVKTQNDGGILPTESSNDNQKETLVEPEHMDTKNEYTESCRGSQEDASTNGGMEVVMQGADAALKPDVLGDETNVDDEVDWEDGASDELDISGMEQSAERQPQQPQIPQWLPLSWEADGASAVGAKVALAISSGDEEELDDDDMDREEDAGDTTLRVASSSPNNTRNRSIFASPKNGGASAIKASNRESQTAAALLAAQATAANLTNWAGRAFRRAMEQHANETGTKFIGGVTTDLQVESEKHIVVGTGQSEVSLQPSALVQAKVNAVSSRWGSKLVVDLTEGTAEARQSTASSRQDANLMDLLEEQVDVLNERGKRQERDMDTVTDEMKADVVQLIQHFGIPYIEAPAEAEAQCVELERLGLVDGVVTEDSDVFVFGGKMVYKNIFDDQKYVEIYRAQDAERDLALGRNAFIALAMLLGGDYTEGVKGVGIVNGMEILQEFDVSSDLRQGLTKFREWLHGFGDENIQQISTDFHLKHRSARSRWTVPENFPADQVMTAYQSPVVDNSRNRFSWGVPDVENLCLFAQQNIGWTAEETKGYLRPVVKKLGETSRQTRIDSYFMKYEDDITFAKVRSKRLRDVFRGIQGSKSA